MSTTRKLTLNSCAVRGPRGPKGDSYPGILRVSVSDLTVSDSGEITACTLSETYDTIRDAVEHLRPVEIICDGYVLRLVYLDQNNLVFGINDIVYPESISDSYAVIRISINRIGVAGTYYIT